MNDLLQVPVLKEINHQIRSGGLRGLRTHHRNILAYIYTQTLKSPGKMYPVPKATNNHPRVYIQSICFLENMGLIVVDRPTDNYKDWFMAFAKPKFSTNQEVSNG